MLPFLPVIASKTLSSLPWAKIILYTGMVLMGVTIYILVNMNASQKLAIKAQEQTIQTKNTQLLEKDVKILEIAKGAESYQKSCKATIKALDKINTYEAAKTRNLQTQIDRIKQYDDSQNGALSPVLRDTLELLQ